MKNTIHVWPEPLIRQDGLITIAAIIETAGMDRCRLWYRVPEACSDWVTKSADSFLLGTLFRAMRAGQDLHVHGTVSPSLLVNLQEFQRAWSLWLPRHYQCVDLRTDHEEERRPVPGQEAILGFSGGVDSAFSAWSHGSRRSGPGKYKLTVGLMVHGLDIPVEETDVFERAAEKSHRMLASIGMELIPMATNFRQLGDRWDDAHGAALASCLTLLGGRFGAGLIASSYTYTELVLPSGSNPVTDGMLSSDSFQIIHDGTAVARLEKIEALCQWPEALQNLRVCWAGPHKDRNCCRCTKCTWVMLAFRILGQPLPESFERDLTDREIMRIRSGYYTMKKRFEPLLARARKASMTASWVRALAFSIWINRLRLVAMRPIRTRKLVRRIDNFLFPPL
ncbi:MAG TPA: hypothetical protein VMC09_03745 [Anaerolineales bacterium]|nr:hypothetical protein [Anaerolineales bacterium]